MLPTDEWNASYNSGTVMTNAVSGGTLLFLLLLILGSVGYQAQVVKVDVGMKQDVKRLGR